ncbi:MAG TPA: hypothetical protein VF535_11995 [Allosphingosinicella sp.]|jgi:hypothetical protein
MRHYLLAAAAAAFAGPLAAAPAPVAPRTMACPIGGGSFQFQQVAPPTVAGERPDGRPVGGIRFPIALPECPDNGLVLYKEYGPAEVAKLEPLIKSEAYRALRKDGTQYYRAYWLMREMGEGPELYLWALLQASWEADGRPELRKRYLEELVEASAKVPPKPTDLTWIGMEGRSINALRELGRFDEALARLDKVPLAGLDVPAPVGAAATPQALAHARSRRGWKTFFTVIRPVIERRDSSAEPLDLLPRSLAAGRCLDEAGKLDETGRAFCAKEAAMVAAVKAARDRQAKELEALRRSREASGR